MLKIYNTLTHKKEEFQPIEPGKVRMYVCGLTTYDYSHIGHARMLVAFDVIVRYLRNSGYAVTYVRNITDVDDKIIRRANENNEPFNELTDRFIAFMHEDEKALNITPPDIEPRATAHIKEIITIIEKLISKEFAYAADNGDVYYAVNKFQGYGKLSRKNPEELLAGARVEIEKSKRDPRDFTLWKPAKEGEPGWDSPWGFGRPGWHIECSAMSSCCLGETFDIHGGGSDLMFPHHENEIAQSEAANGEKFVHTWMHNGPVRVDDEKMSKSLDNFFTIREVLKKYPAEVIRYFLLSSQYRSAINYSEENLQTAYAALERFYNALKGIEVGQGVAPDDSDSGGSSVYEKRFHTAMDDDFNTPEAIGVLFELVREINRLRDTDVEQAQQLVVLLKKLAGVLGILEMSAEEFLREGSDDIDATHVESLIAQRKQAREDKDWTRADQIRDELAALNVVLEDKDGVTSWRIERR
ncbi:cysteine--tRNA ligase [Haliea sp. AH-315-K21]|uniref:Cysteine--tRNA ligase n=1 Tax=SAR86 cluster bacterium TaxID=2030880 RepID=A0A2A5C8C7_9GAMM|nr:cysteine--tRNA ligase [Haliea sp. AH-315-K21]PCJ40003.1 MAG: cysteine--tRNA ligase [SAR86 cluster bacterium]